jgi:hypothetical protein
MNRIAWCAVCNDAQECDDRGCIVCAVLYEKSLPPRRAIAKRTRARRKAEGVCINGRVHGAPVAGQIKCERCVEVHRRSR